MAVTVAGIAGDDAADTSDTSIVVPAPAGTGGLLVAFGACNAARTISPPAGWTERVTVAGTYRAYIWTRADDAASDYAFTISGTFNEASVIVIRLNGADGSSFVTASATSDGTSDGDRQTVEAPGLTTAADGSMVLWIYGSTAGQSVASAPATVNEEHDRTGGTAGAHLWVGSKTVASAGAEGGKTVTKSGFGHWAAATIAIAPSVGGATGILRQMLLHHGG